MHDVLSLTEPSDRQVTGYKLLHFECKCVIAALPLEKPLPVNIIQAAITLPLPAQGSASGLSHLPETLSIEVPAFSGGDAWIDMYGAAMLIHTN